MPFEPIRGELVAESKMAPEYCGLFRAPGPKRTTVLLELEK